MNYLDIVNFVENLGEIMRCKHCGEKIFKGKNNQWYHNRYNIFDEQGFPTSLCIKKGFCSKPEPEEKI